MRVVLCGSSFLIGSHDLDPPQKPQEEKCKWRHSSVNFSHMLILHVYSAMGALNNSFSFLEDIFSFNDDCYCLGSELSLFEIATTAASTI